MIFESQITRTLTGRYRIEYRWNTGRNEHTDIDEFESEKQAILYNESLTHTAFLIRYAGWLNQITPLNEITNEDYIQAINSLTYFLKNKLDSIRTYLPRLIPTLIKLLPPKDHENFQVLKSEFDELTEFVNMLKKS